jgi:release factor glutamine methyltransferase
LSAAARRLTAGGVPNAVGEAKELVSKALGGNRKTLDLRRGEAWSSSSESILNLLLLQRLDHVPLAYLLNEWDFLDMTLTVTPDVLIPRPETEELFQWVAGEHRVEGALADVGTGAGGLALAAARQWPRVRVTAIDLSAAALAVARWNARRHGVEERIEFRQADLLEGVNVRSLGVVVANLPYVATGDLSDLAPDVLKEPRRALDGGPDGLSVIRRLIPQAYGALEQGGRLFLEVGQGQAMAVGQAVTQAGFSDVSIVRDFAGIDRFIRGTR